LKEEDMPLYRLKKTGSLARLQQLMGHSSLQVSLTNLRGLEVPALKVKDMPTL